MELDDHVDQIRRRMAELRRELASDVQDVGRSARAMTDVGRYVRRYPWLSVTGAMALGYFVVPKKEQRVVADPRLVARLIDQRLQTEPQNSTQGAIKSLVVMGLMAAARAGISLMTQRYATAMRPTVSTPEASPTPCEPTRDYLGA